MASHRRGTRAARRGYRGEGRVIGGEAAALAPGPSQTATNAQRRAVNLGTTASARRSRTSNVRRGEWETISEGPGGQAPPARQAQGTNPTVRWCRYPSLGRECGQRGAAVSVGSAWQYQAKRLAVKKPYCPPSTKPTPSHAEGKTPDIRMNRSPRVA